MVSKHTRHLDYSATNPISLKSPTPSHLCPSLPRRMASAQMQVAPTPTISGSYRGHPLPPPALEDLPPPPPRSPSPSSTSKRQTRGSAASTSTSPRAPRRIWLRPWPGLAGVLGSGPTEGDVQCMRWIFENWRLDAIGDHEKPPAKESVARWQRPGHLQASLSSFTAGVNQEPAGPRPSRKRDRHVPSNSPV